MKTGRRILVSYYSLTGNTARVARDLAARLGADLESIQDRGHGSGFIGSIQAAYHAWRGRPATIGAAQYDPANYDLTIVGTPVWVGCMTPAARAYLQANRGKFHDVAFFVTSGGTDVAKLAPALQAVAGHAPVAVAGFDKGELADAKAYRLKLVHFERDICRSQDGKVTQPQVSELLASS